MPETLCIPPSLESPPRLALHVHPRTAKSNRCRQTGPADHHAARYAGPLVFESFDPALVAATRRAGFEGAIGIISERYVGQDEDYQWLSPGDLSGYPPASDQQQSKVMNVANKDGFNWGYDPWHYTVPEGSYSTDPDGPARIVEFRS